MNTTISYQIRPQTSPPVFTPCEFGIRVAQCKHETRCRYFPKLGFGRVTGSEPAPLAVFPDSLGGLENAMKEALKLSRTQPVELVSVQVIGTYEDGRKAQS